MSFNITDLDELIREVDRLAEQRDWDELNRLRIYARKAFERGHQLWPAGDWAAYRLAREADAELASLMINEDAARFALGPLAEVAASTHTWKDLEPFLDEGPARASVFVERIMRGESCEPYDEYSLHRSAPPVIGSWEPEYLLATYHLDRVEIPELPSAEFAPQGLPHADLEPGDPPGAEALEAVVARWRHQSDTAIATSAIDGSAIAAIAALSSQQGGSEIILAEQTCAQALQYLAWAGATSGLSGRRAGASVGREAAIVVLMATAGLPEDATAAELQEASQELRWYQWDIATQSGGLKCRVAIEDPTESLAWAIDAYEPAIRRNASSPSA